MTPLPIHLLPESGGFPNSEIAPVDPLGSLPETQDSGKLAEIAPLTWKWSSATIQAHKIRRATVSILYCYRCRTLSFSVAVTIEDRSYMILQA